ncbi:type II secretion system F family protein [Cellulomonas alba]|uniref:Type II secretion system F family protein n=1 Tax=Cellulomonas alba TaxID=3053467 RepID=A0ABT7SKD5_9CELL|nr:type II secretion system F family protein [Cellulomonas alba]MDM7856621.1 type II secretion system F family protein [Cellulomonas alba]
MGVVVGLLLGAGVACLWWSCWPPPPHAAESRRRRGSRVADLLVQAGVVGVTPGALVGASVALAIAVLAVGVGVTHAPAIALAFALFAGAAPAAYVRGRARRRQARLRSLWPEVVDHLASGVRAGLALPEAVAQLGERGPVELRPAFVTFARDYRATGRFADCLDALAARLADPVADRIVEALRLTRDVGGTDLGRMLRTLSSFLRDDLRVRSELEARQSWTVYAARLAVAAPWVVLALLSTRPQAAAAYRTPGGVLVLAVGGVCTVVAYSAMLRIGQLPEDPRVLR